MNTRKITSLTLLVSFILLMLTSIILYISPHGRVAYWSDWHLWGFTRTEWTNLHLNIGVLFLIAFLFHFFYNLSVITAYLKNKAKNIRVFTVNFNVALGLTLAVCIGTYYMIPPMNLVINAGELFSGWADAKYGEPPYGHAELSSLKIFAARVNLDLEKIKEIFSTRGIVIEGDKQPVGEIAKANNLTAKELFEIMQPAAIYQPEGSTFPDEPPPGFGRKTLADVCAEYDLHTPTVLAAFQQNKIKAELTQTIKEIADQNNKEAMAIFELIHEAARGNQK